MACSVGNKRTARNAFGLMPLNIKLNSLERRQEKRNLPPLSSMQQNNIQQKLNPQKNKK